MNERFERALVGAAVAFLAVYDEDAIVSAGQNAIRAMGGTPAGQEAPSVGDPGGADDVALTAEKPSGNIKPEKPAETASESNTGTEDDTSGETEPGDEPVELKLDDVLSRFSDLLPLGDAVEIVVGKGDAAETKEVPAGRVIGGELVKSFGVSKVRAIPAEQWGAVIDRLDTAIAGIENGDDLDTIVAAVTGGQ